MFRVPLDTLSYSPRLLQTDRVRAHQNRISWFGEEAPNARVEIGDHGVKIGQIEHKACAPFARRSSSELRCQTEAVHQSKFVRCAEAGRCFLIGHTYQRLQYTQSM